MPGNSRDLAVSFSYLLIRPCSSPFLPPTDPFALELLEGTIAYGTRCQLPFLFRPSPPQYFPENADAAAALQYLLSTRIAASTAVAKRLKSATKDEINGLNASSVRARIYRSLSLKRSGLFHT